MKNSEIAREFIDAINGQELDKIAHLISEDHEFVDATGASYMGKQDILQGWPAYFELFPDYSIEIANILVEKESVGIFGYASGTFKNLKDTTGSNYWRIPAAWKGIIRNNLIVYWQVYCDYAPINDIIRRNNPNCQV